MEVGHLVNNQYCKATVNLKEMLLASNCSLPIEVYSPLYCAELYCTVRDSIQLYTVLYCTLLHSSLFKSTSVNSVYSTLLYSPLLYTQFFSPIYSILFKSSLYCTPLATLFYSIPFYSTHCSVLLYSIQLYYDLLYTALLLSMKRMVKRNLFGVHNRIDNEMTYISLYFVNARACEFEQKR